jgi:hypothetical protein
MSKMCYFCSKNKTIEHLFDCLGAPFLWRVVHFVLGLKPLEDIRDFFYKWYKQGGIKSIYVADRMCNHSLNNMVYKE